MFKIPELLKATRGKLVSGGDKAIVKGISIDSRTIKKGEAFIAIKGNNFDGHLFIAEALRKGACCVITRKKRKSTARLLSGLKIRVRPWGISLIFIAGDLSCLLSR